MSKHDLSEYSFAKEVVRDFPIILGLIKELYTKLNKYRDYYGVTNILYAMDSSVEMMSKQYRHYKKVLDEKGKI